MDIKSAEFVSSYADVAKCPPPDKPEFAFIGRSNVGKSSLINMLTQRNYLAKTSGKPGKTQTINHFIINGSWFMVDLPGYGYASVSKDKREGFGQMIEEYILKRENLYCLFILIDIRLEPQQNDLDFIHWCGSKEIPMCLTFTKADKLTKHQTHRSITIYSNTLKKTWDDLPPFIITSASHKTGREDLLLFIENALADNA
jgi:GTP-binding protein